MLARLTKFVRDLCGEKPNNNSELKEILNKEISHQNQIEEATAELIRAVKIGSVGDVHKALSRGADVNRKFNCLAGWDGYQLSNLLTQAITDGNEDIVRALVLAGANLKEADYFQAAEGCYLSAYDVYKNGDLDDMVNKSHGVDFHDNPDEMSQRLDEAIKRSKISTFIAKSYACQGVSPGVQRAEELKTHTLKLQR